MTWAKIECRMPDHRKWSGLSDSAFRLAIELLCWSSDQSALGHPAVIDRSTIDRRAKGTKKRIDSLISELEKAGSPVHASGLLERVPGGWIFHDLPDYMPKDDTSARLSAAGKAGASKRWSHGPHDGPHDGPHEAPTNKNPWPPMARACAGASDLSESDPDPDPDLTPGVKPDRDPEPASRTPAAQLPHHRALERAFQANVESWAGWTTAQELRLRKSGTEPARAAERFRNHHRSKGTRSSDWEAEANVWVLGDEDRAARAGKPMGSAPDHDEAAAHARREAEYQRQRREDLERERGAVPCPPDIAVQMAKMLGTVGSGLQERGSGSGALRAAKTTVGSYETKNASTGHPGAKGAA